MQQRRLRLGDILDDYCPRERRLTNHAVVAMIDDDVRQTRCTTCDTEHEYKQGKAPTLRKKKDSVSTAYHEVLAGVTKGAPETSPPQPEDPPSATAEPPEAPASEPLAAAPAQAQAQDAAEAAISENPEQGEEGEATAEGRVHRRLIRATLPRPENHQVVRPLPQFTMRQPTGRAGKFRPGGRGPRPGAPSRGGSPSSGAQRGFSARNGGQTGRGGARPDAQRGRGGQPRHGKKH